MRCTAPARLTGTSLPAQTSRPRSKKRAHSALARMRLAMRITSSAGAPKASAAAAACPASSPPLPVCHSSTRCTAEPRREAGLSAARIGTASGARPGQPGSPSTDGPGSEIETSGRRRPATLQHEPVLDPQGLRMRA